MESYSVKDIQQPYKIIQNNLDEYNLKIQKLSELTDQDKKEHLEKAKPLSSSQKLFDEYVCVFCQTLPLDPLICSACDMILMCRKCKDDWLSKDRWQSQNRGQFKCP